MDAQTYPHGVLEMEASPHKVEKPAEAGNLQRRCGYSFQLQKGILADSSQPNIEHSPLKPTAWEGWIPVFLFLLPQVCSGVNRGGAVYQTGTHGSVGGRLAN